MKPEQMLKNKLWGWTVHGVSKDGRWTANEQEYFTECPFCMSSNGFYINPEKKVFDCKVCSKSGGYRKFLKYVHEMNKAALKDFHVQGLSEDRGLPIDAFRGIGLGWNGGRFTIPVYDVNKELIGLDLYMVGEKIMHSPKPANIGLFNAPALKEHMNGPIIICEGLWDALALRWLLKEVNGKGTVISVPGAQTSVVEWEIFMYDKDIIVLYDHDQPGVTGEFKTYQILSQKVKSLSFLHWPEKKKLGYDIRDHICKWAVKKANPKKAYRLIKKWLSDVPRHLSNMAIINPKGDTVLERRKEALEAISFKELIKVYEDLLYLPNTDPVKILLGTIYANRFRSDMVWVFLVAPPSSGKSELILSLDGVPEIEHVSQVTEHTFVSGYLGNGGNDVSLFDRLRNRIMAIKDFTPILQTIPQKQQQIFGTLRDAYDGKTDAMYGHAVNRRFTGLHFGIIAGVTSEIENFGKMQQALGERFLRYYLPVVTPEIEKEMSKKSESNITNEKRKREALKHAVYRFLETNKDTFIPTRSDTIREQIRDIARFTAIMRGIVPRDWRERVQYTPTKEGSMRVNKQLSLLAMGLAALEKKQAVGEEEVRLIKEVALSTCPDIPKKAVKALYDAGKLPLSQKDLEDVTGFPVSTLRYVLDDLKMLSLVSKVGAGFKSLFMLTDASRDLIRLSGIWAANDAISRPPSVNGGSTQRKSK